MKRLSFHGTNGVSPHGTNSVVSVVNIITRHPDSNQDNVIRLTANNQSQGMQNMLHIQIPWHFGSTFTEKIALDFII